MVLLSTSTDASVCSTVVLITIYLAFCMLYCFSFVSICFMMLWNMPGCLRYLWYRVLIGEDLIILSDQWAKGKFYFDYILLLLSLSEKSMVCWAFPFFFLEISYTWDVWEGNQVRSNVPVRKTILVIHIVYSNYLFPLVITTQVILADACYCGFISVVACHKVFPSKYPPQRRINSHVGILSEACLFWT